MSRIPYSSVVGSLMYATLCIRPDIAHAVGVVSSDMNNPGKEHWKAVQWILRYLRGTLLMHYVLEVQTLFYRDMLMHIWLVIKTVGGAPQGMCEQ